MNSNADTESQKLMAIATLAENFGRELSTGLCSVWLDLLEPYPAKLVKAAVQAVIERYEYKTMPPFAVLKKELDALTGSGEQGLALQAEAEWVWLQDNICRHGRAYRPQDMHPTTAYVLRVMGGWEAACDWETRSLDFKRRDFLECWKQAHGKTDAMALGAEATRAALAQAFTGRLVPLDAAFPGTMKAVTGTKAPSVPTPEDLEANAARAKTWAAKWKAQRRAEEVVQ